MLLAGLRLSFKSRAVETKRTHLGLTFIKGMRREGRKYRDGTILDPRNGVTYSGEIDLSRVSAVSTHETD